MEKVSSNSIVIGKNNAYSTKVDWDIAQRVLLIRLFEEKKKQIGK